VKAVYQAARGGLNGRRLQAIVIGLVLFACTAASTLALGMLVDTRTPFGHAFVVQHGADVTASVAPSASAADLTATTRLPGVTAFAGPFPQTTAAANANIPGIPGAAALPLPLTGRASPGGPVDDLTLQSGHWPTADDQLVWADKGPLSGVMRLGVRVTLTGLAGSPVLTVVGIADSVTNTSTAWVLPGEIAALQRAGAPAEGSQLLYRFARVGTEAAVNADIARVTAALPAGALLQSTSYLSVQQSESSNNAPWVPFILTFGIIALVMSVLIVVNVVSGAVVAGTTRIGVLKSIGFTPVQVVGSYVLQVALPAVVGCVAGVVVGNLLAAPLLKQNATVYQVSHLGIPPWVDGLVLLAILVLTGIAAVLPALRAGRMSAVQAIATGRAPRPRHGYLAHRLLGRVRWLPRAVTIGIAAPFARPTRTLVTAAAVLFGAIAVTFGAGLATSLDRVQANLSLAQTEPVQVSYFGNTPGPPPVHGGGKHQVPKGAPTPQPGGGPSGLTAAQSRTIASALRAQPGTLRYVPETDDNAHVTGQTNSVDLTAYTGDASWVGYALISGHWYSGPDQMDVNTEFLTATGTSVGSVYTFPAIGTNGKPVTVRIVGEVFQPGNRLDAYLSSATLSVLDPGAAPSQYDVGLRPGVSAQAYANAVGARLGPAYGVNVNASNSPVFDAVLALVSLLTILLVVVAGLGVLNTVVLQLRERVHDLGVFKAVGMTPRQAIAMVICSVFAVGLVTGVVAVPLGVLLQHGIVPVMAHAANSGLPSSMISVYSLPELIALALAGLVIAVVGALGPASWAARTRTAAALRTE
jgi:putative ABC transport system permease protein